MCFDLRQARQPGPPPNPEPEYGDAARPSQPPTPCGPTPRGL
ncbi:hypothetical protein C882_2019 [Caenispirillum salinarum AK4]|uniref:Uncharacterized protein n=1 Tax=Caenispirillum salinarum AK4 TaxID=1238182 RepID=K9GM59_9PROT|nr:hypothetical protein C882_2019 [Caenispirillum salinarum AK4]